MKFADNFLWKNPGIPSISVSYFPTNDYFFSGHVGLPALIALECRKLGFRKIMYLAIFTIFVEAFTLHVARAHYCIDLITGVIVAHYIFIITDKYIHIIDGSFMGKLNE
jgi:hypothetical protein